METVLALETMIKVPFMCRKVLYADRKLTKALHAGHTHMHSHILTRKSLFEQELHVTLPLNSNDLTKTI